MTGAKKRNQSGIEIIEHSGLVYINFKDLLNAIRSGKENSDPDFKAAFENFELILNEALKLYFVEKDKRRKRRQKTTA